MSFDVYFDERTEVLTLTLIVPRGEIPSLNKVSRHPEAQRRILFLSAFFCLNGGFVEVVFMNALPYFRIAEGLALVNVLGLIL